MVPWPPHTFNVVCGQMADRNAWLRGSAARFGLSWVSISRTLAGMAQQMLAILPFRVWIRIPGLPSGVVSAPVAVVMYGQGLEINALCRCSKDCGAAQEDLSLTDSRRCVGLFAQFVRSNEIKNRAGSDDVHLPLVVQKIDQAAGYDRRRMVWPAVPSFHKILPVDAS